VNRLTKEKIVKVPRIWIAFALAAALGSTLLAQEPSLGDLARKNRKSGTKKALTNEDLPKGGDGVSTVGEAVPAPQEAAGAQAGETAAAEASSAETAQDAGSAAPADAEVQTMELRLKNLKYEEAGLERRIAKMEADLEEAETEFRREMYRTGLENARSNLDNVRVQREQTEKALDDTKKTDPGKADAANADPQQSAAAENQPE
jgi:chromosome segregation ATPase